MYAWCSCSLLADLALLMYKSQQVDQWCLLFVLLVAGGCVVFVGFFFLL